MPRRNRYRARPKARSVRMRAAAAEEASATDSEPEPSHGEHLDFFPRIFLGGGRSSESNEPDPPLPCIIVEQLKTDCCFLFNHGIGNPEMELLAEVFKENKSVTELNLGSNRIGDPGVLALFYPLRTDTLLTVLHLHRNQIGDAGATVLAEALKTNMTLRELYLGSNFVGDIGAEAFAQALKTNLTLRKLNFAHNTIGDSGLESLSEALKLNTGLAELNLDYNVIAERGVAALTALHNSNKTLHKVSLVGNMVKEEKESPALPVVAAENDLNEEEYTINAEVGNLSELGVSLRMIDTELIIDAIHSGIVQEWNEKSPPDVQVEVGDCIAEVNGKHACVQELVSACEETRDLTFVLKRKHAFTLSVHAGHQVFIEGNKDRPEVNGQQALAVKWFDPVKRWKVKLQDGTVMMCKREELKIDRSQVLAGGYKAGDLVSSRFSCTLNTGSRLNEGNVGMVVAPVGEASVVGDLGLLVKFSLGNIIMLATNIMPKDGHLAPAEFHISLNSEGPGGLGASVEVPRDGSSLVIKSIAPGGLIDDWNRCCDPNAVVTEGARIVEVNGFRGDARKLVTECKECLVQTIVIMRQA